MGNVYHRFTGSLTPDAGPARAAAEPAAGPAAGERPKDAAEPAGAPAAGEGPKDAAGGDAPRGGDARGQDVDETGGPIAA